MLGTEKRRREGEGKRQKGLGMENSHGPYGNYGFLSAPKTDVKMFWFFFFNKFQLKWKGKTGEEGIKTKPKATALAGQASE